MRIHEITGKNKFCGPAALSTIFGITTDHAAREIKSFSNSQRITGVKEQYLLSAIEKLGGKVKYINIREEYKSVVEWIKNSSHTKNKNNFIIVFGCKKASHYGVVANDKYQCSVSKSEVSIDEIPYQPFNGIVYGIIHIIEVPESTPGDKFKSNKSTLAKAKRIASKIGVVIESKFGSYDVFCPALDHDDPLEGKNSVDDANSVLDLVCKYKRFLEGGYLEAVTDPCLFSEFGSLGVNSMNRDQFAKAGSAA